MTPTEHHYERVAAAIRYLREHAQEQPSLEDVAAHVHLSKYHFQRLFREWAGVSPKRFLQHLTLEHAKAGLRAGVSTLEAAHAAGLSGNGRLHDLFVQLQGCSPGAWRDRGAGVDITYREITTPFGVALAAATELGICFLSFLERNANPEQELRREFPEARLHRGDSVHLRAVGRFFKDWQLPDKPLVLDLRGTPFQLSVWRALLQIPSGHLRSYGDIATQVGKPAAVRAVGTAIGKNPIAFLIPCHRVLRQNGALGGYRWGPERKEIMVGYEAVR
ncbi:bifunctional transcriptional activator/DNA repair enzyme AdaA [Lewinella sp. W8]|uniref:bifunctional transcriptional activator/DNA repair enzyme AdaA n=1 Tax=Lewinella sp. W8 TaxID=2528208 RepID=UPI001068C392|nr:methylated-DNA--[protein]-cysteine S-methyltransferase [Lewinella sp. W8]MTB53717.1 methylated-DNA--[protein]-cysteine S-methyltransferase [Lewinella sp. W8]